MPRTQKYSVDLSADGRAELNVMVKSGSAKHTFSHVRVPAQPGAVARYDYTYERNGTRNLFMMSEPLTGWRHVDVTKRRRKQECAEQMRSLV
jgi:hypothetical protein